MDRISPKFGLDRAAMVLSGLCLAHCLATAVLIGVLSTASAFLANPAIHEAGLAVATVLGAVALLSGWRSHRLTQPLIIGFGGLTAMALALAVPHGAPEMILTMGGVATLAYAHHLNRRAQA